MTVPMTVLIVDDHPGFRNCARMLLEAEGFQVIGEAENGVAALRTAKELHPDVILLDVGLPDFDGFEVAARLSQGGSNGPAIVLTSIREDWDAGRLVPESGARGFIPKAELSGAAITQLVR
jgi:DNA-binding NarL/FixJ family response regulator